MILKSLEIKNIRSHKVTNVEFSKGIIVFTGRTGSGKSTLIMAIQYALFGANARIPNPELLRRQSTRGYVKLGFSHKGHDYVVVRGLKSQGDRVVVDTSTLSLSRDGARIPILERASDLDEKILRILGYPAGVDPVKLFEVTTYSKQDEIRNLIEMKPTERQGYIDKLLQIQRYENTWDNLKDIVNSLASEIAVLEENVKTEDLLTGQLKESKNKIEKLGSKVSSDKTKLASAKERLKGVSNKVLEEKQRFDKVMELKTHYDSARLQFESKTSELESLDLELTALKKKIKGLEEEMPKVDETEKIVSRKAELDSEISQENNRIEELAKKIRDVENLKGECPLCGSKITQKHKSKVEDEYKKILAESQKNVTKLGEEIVVVNKELPQARRRDEIKKSIESNEKVLEEKDSRMRQIREELKELDSKIKGIKLDAKAYDSLKQEIDKLQEEKNKLSSETSSLETEIKAYEEQIDDEKKRIAELEKQVSEFKVIKEKLLKLKAGVELLTKLRQDIRSIRERVRTRFLNDFKVEFQVKFEEIRRFEEEYSVDVKNDYEPVAYASGEEAPISTLSGGEKTSVALSYRLALADIAAQIGGIQESELLMLDEPTTGFDEDDIRALPEALTNLRTIPQIVIVTHAEELKEAADYKFEVEKHSGVSEVKLLEM
jgi:exonuclease SbcC